MNDQERREASLEAAKAKVASIPADHRRYLEGEFLRAEQEAAAIMRYGRGCSDCQSSTCQCDGSEW